MCYYLSIQAPGEESYSTAVNATDLVVSRGWDGHEVKNIIFTYYYTTSNRTVVKNEKRPFKWWSELSS